MPPMTFLLSPIGKVFYLNELTRSWQNSPDFVKRFKIARETVRFARTFWQPPKRPFSLTEFPLSFFETSLEPFGEETSPDR